MDQNDGLVRAYNHQKIKVASCTSAIGVSLISPNRVGTDFSLPCATIAATQQLLQGGWIVLARPWVARCARNLLGDLEAGNPQKKTKGSVPTSFWGSMYAYSHLEDRVVKIQGLCAWTEWSTFHNITNYVARVKINVCTYIYIYMHVTIYA